MTPTVTVWVKPNGLPIAMTQSPGSICVGVAELHFRQRRRRHLGELNECAVGERVAADYLGRVVLAEAGAKQADADPLGTLDDVVVGEDEARLVDDEPGAGAFADAAALLTRILAGAAAAAVGRRAAPARRSVRAARPAAPPPKKSVSSRVRARASVRMLTTVGICAFAMFLKVEASTGPLSGALLLAGTLTVCALEAWCQVEPRGDHHPDRQRRDCNEDGVEQRGLSCGHFFELPD